MTTRLLMNFEDGIVDEAENRNVTVDGASLTSSARFGSQALEFPSATSAVQIDGALVFDGDFTFETWGWLPTDTSSWATFFGVKNSSVSLLDVSSTGVLQSQFAGFYTAGAIQVPREQWVHLAVTRISGLLKLFVDGVEDASAQKPNSYTYELRLGYSPLSFLGPNLPGMRMDGARVILGKALYKNTFTPPTSPPTIEYPLFDQLSMATSLNGPTLINPMLRTTVVPQPPYVFTYDPEVGTYTLTGTVKERGTPNMPLYRKVQLLEEISGRLVGETFSDPITGAYTFTGLLNRRYTVVSRDHTLYYRAVVADNLEPQ